MSGSTRRPPMLLHRAAVAVVVVVTLVFLLPVLAAPVTGDDRWWYLALGSETGWSPIGEVRRLPAALEVRMDNGRVNVLTEVERRLAARALSQAAVATGTSVTVFLSLLKLLLAMAGLACAVALVRTVRWRAREGHLVRATRRTLMLIGTAGALGVAVGARPHTAVQFPIHNGLNGWTSYPVSTYGAIVAIFGVVALVLWLTRLVAERGRRTLVATVVLLGLLGVATAFRYELAFPAVPVVVIALAVFPVTERDHRRRGTRAKLVTGGAYVGGFVPAFVITRVMLRRICAEGDCYQAVLPDPSGETLRTIAYNLLSTVPGTGNDELRTSVAEAGLTAAVPVGATGWSLLVGALAAAALCVVWWTAPPGVPGRGAAGEAAGMAGPSPRAEAALLLAVSGVFLLGALGPATVMGLSAWARVLVEEPGVLYRNAVVTWTGLAFALVCAVVAGCRLLPARLGFASWAAFAVLIGSVGAVTLPGSFLALHANRLNNQLTELVNSEVVYGDTRPGSDERRCALVEQMRHDPSLASWARTALVTHADAAFRRYHGQPFCSDPEVTPHAPARVSSPEEP